MKTGIVIQARMESTRLPGKVLMPLPQHQKKLWEESGEYVPLTKASGSDLVTLDWVIRVCLATDFPVIVATSTNDADNAIAEHVEQRWCNEVPIFRGHPTDVLDRMYRCALAHSLDRIVRVTGDCPFVDPDVIRQVVALHEYAGADYASNVDPPTWPDGLDVQVMTFDALARSWRHATEPTDRDTVCQFIVRNRRDFSVVNLPCPFPGIEKRRWVLDTEEDYAVCSGIAELLMKKKNFRPRFIDLLALGADGSQRGGRNERYLAHRAEELKSLSFDRSGFSRRLATAVQPYGASTYSKSHVAWGQDAPLYTTHAQGSRVWDVDGNEFIDFTGGLGTTILGHADPEIRDAITHQLDRGIVSPLADNAERVTAFRLLNMIGRHEDMVVFGKNGSDVTTAAVRVARVARQRMTIIKSLEGYHGWPEWALAGDSIRSGGLIRAENADVIRAQTVRMAALDTDAAAIIIEPDHYGLEELREIMFRARKRGTLVIFDEMVTAFRYPRLTYAATHGLDPDMICLGKALGNGMPVTALVGRKGIMENFVSTQGEPYAFYSGTHFGECLSLAAARCVLGRMQADELLQLSAKATRINEILNEAVGHKQMMDLVTVGKAPLSRLTFSNPLTAAHFRREMAHRGILVYSAFFAMLAHSDADLKHLEDAINGTFHALAEGDGLARGPLEAPGAGIMRS